MTTSPNTNLNSSSTNIIRDNFLNLESAILPQHYQLHFDFEFSTLNYYGNVELTGSLRFKPGSTTQLITKRLQLHNRINEILMIRVRHGNHIFQARTNRLDYDLIELINEETDSREFDFDSCNGDTVTIEYRFLGQITDKFDGIYRNMIVNDNEGTVAGQKYYATTQCEPIGCMAIFPSIDAPSAKAKFSLSLTIDERINAISNMDVKRKIHLKDKKKMFYEFETTPVMSTYLFGLFLGDYERVMTMSKRNVVIGIYTRPHDIKYTKFALDVTPKMLDFFEDYFGINYMLPKLDSIVVDKFESSAMENYGIISYRKSAMLVTEQTGTEDIRSLGQVIAHEITHQWFGNYVTMKWWSDLWLNEGFATFLMYLCADQILPELDIEDHFLQNRMISGFLFDALHNSHPISVEIKNTSEIRENFDAISYMKSAAYLRMMQAYMGPEKFRSGVSKYLNMYKYSNADYIQFLEAIKSDAEDFDIVDVSEKWLCDQNFPIVSVSLSDDKKFLHLKQAKFYFLDLDMNKDDPCDVFQIPMTIKRINKNGCITHDKLLMKSSKMCLEIEPGEIVLFNPNTNGFYLVIYDESLQQLIGSHGESVSDLDYFSIIASMGICALGNKIKCDSITSINDIRSMLKFVTKYHSHFGKSSYTILIKILSMTKALLGEIPDIDCSLQKFAETIALDHYNELKKKCKLSAAEKNLVNVLLEFMIKNRVLKAIEMVKSECPSIESAPSDKVTLIGSILLKEAQSDECKCLFDKIFNMAKEHHDETIKQRLLLALSSASSKDVRQDLYRMLFDGTINPMDSRSVTPSIGRNPHLAKEFAEFMIQDHVMEKFKDNYPVVIASRLLIGSFKSLRDVNIGRELYMQLQKYNIQASRSMAQFMEIVEINDKLFKSYATE